MTETDRIVDELRRAYEGDAWHGPSLGEALEGVDARQAMLRPLVGAHTIGEIVLHITAWTREVTRRLRDGIARDPVEGDWPAAGELDEVRWTEILRALESANAELVAEIARVGDGQLGGVIGDARNRALGSGVSRYVTLHGLVQHHAYHGGQISMLRSAVRRVAG
jgi:uncharacterized damage-inducible protein DinB